VEEINFVEIFYLLGSNSAVVRSSASQLNQTESDGNKCAKKQTHKAANVVAETSPGQFNNRSINDDEVPTVGGKQSFSYDSSMSSRRLTSQYPEAKRRSTFSTLSEGITVEKQFLAEKNTQREGHTRHKVMNQREARYTSIPAKGPTVAFLLLV
jgi:hypothetical protein